jgi:isopenicillin N synthase-like dioxygenase
LRLDVRPEDLIPTIDVSKFTSGTDAQSIRISREVAHACERIGFLVIEGHGIPQPVFDRVYAAGRAFFHLPAEVKERYRYRPPESYGGYTPLETVNLAYSLRKHADARPDFKEGFGTGRPDVAPDDRFFVQQHPEFYKAVRWPAEVPGFREAWLDYYRSITGVAEKFLRIVAVALDLPVDHFDWMMDRHVSNCTIFNYPEQRRAPRKGQLRSGEHTDFGSLSFVHSDWSIAGGLQVFKDGEWIDVPAGPGTFVINIGDMMQRWTNDRWVSTLHRVVNPPADSGISGRRMSLVYFHLPNPDVVVECFPSCRDAEHPAKYPPITIGEHHLMKIGQMYDGKQRQSA